MPAILQTADIPLDPVAAEAVQQTLDALTAGPGGEGEIGPVESSARQAAEGADDAQDNESTETPSSNADIVAALDRTNRLLTQMLAAIESLPAPQNPVY